VSEGPDMTAMKEAFERKRAITGQSVTFFQPLEPTWPPDTELDPESGQPFDPLIEPVASGVASAVVNCDIAFRPVAGLDGGQVSTPVGGFETGDVVLIMGAKDYDDNEVVRNARQFDAKDGTYKLTQAKRDGIGSEYRVLVWGKLMEDNT
jgi:hypothetical protein